jgi:hypothetical protein
MSDDQNFLELAAMYRRLAARTQTPEMVRKYRELALQFEAAAHRQDPMGSESGMMAPIRERIHS